MGFKKLTERRYYLISSGVKIEGSYDPKEIMFYFEEELTSSEYDEIEKFLQWCHDNDKKFGSGNYEDVYKEFKSKK